MNLLFSHDQGSQDRHVPLVALAAVVAGALFYALVVYPRAPGIGFVLFQALALSIIGFLSTETGHRVRAEGWVAAAFSFVFALAVAVWTSELGTAVALIGWAASSLMFALYASGHHATFYHPVLLIRAVVVDVPLRALTRVRLFSRIPFPLTASKRVSSVAVGLLLLVPVLLVFGGLLTSADAAFARVVSEAFGDLSAPFALRHVVSVAFWSAAFGGAFGLAFWHRHAFADSFRPSPGWRVESAVILSGVVALFAVFLVVQSAYLFGGREMFAELGMTYSEYARAGFNELVAVATLSLLLFLTLRYAHGEDVRRELRALHGALLAETLLVLGSAAYRMGMYIDAYGYTQARLFTYWFLAMVAGLIVLAGTHLFLATSQARFMRQGLLVAGTFALLFAWSAPEDMALRLNADRIRARGYVELGDLMRATAESVPMLAALEAEGIPLDPEVTWSPSEGDANVYARPSGDWRSWNWSRFRLPPGQPFPYLGGN